MIKIDLITGFLGAGKTTFLLSYAKYLISQGKKIGILAFDHGAVNVDLPLLGSLRCESCELEMLAACCDADSHARRFRSKLISMGMYGYDRVIVEPSGIFDPDEFFDTLQESPLDRWYEIGSVITIVDAKLPLKLPREAEILLGSQAACAGCIVLSKTQLASEQEIASTKEHLSTAGHLIHCPAIARKKVIQKAWSEFTDSDFESLSTCGYELCDYVKLNAGEKSGFHSVSFLNLLLNREEILQAIHLLFETDEYGKIFRVKGFFQDEGKWFQVNATAEECIVEEIPQAGSAVIVIGTGLEEEKIAALMQSRCY